MPGLANNYYAVLARCELGRQRLGLTEGKILDVAVERVREFLTKNSAGFLDDSEGGDGRYDIYSADTLLFLWPLRDRLGPAYEAWAYGRSIGALSVCLTLQLGALAVRENWASDRTRMAGLVGNAFAKLPVVAQAATWDYEPWLHAPGLFESPVEMEVSCGGPAGVKKGSLGMPVAVEKMPGGLRLRFESKELTRTVQFRVEGDTVVGEEHWQFQEVPARVGFMVPEARRPLWLGIESANAHHQSTVMTAETLNLLRLLG